MVNNTIYRVVSVTWWLYNYTSVSSWVEVLALLVYLSRSILLVVYKLCSGDRGSFNLNSSMAQPEHVWIGVGAEIRIL